MSSQPNRSHDFTSADLIEVHALYHQLLDSWNIRDAGRFPNLFEDNGNSIGFDGSQMNSRLEIATEVLRIFGDHQTASYVGKIREVRFLTPEVAIGEPLPVWFPRVNRISILWSTPYRP